MIDALRLPNDVPRGQRKSGPTVVIKIIVVKLLTCTNCLEKNAPSKMFYSFSSSCIESHNKKSCNAVLVL